jgi:hypothetical protein
MLNYKPLSHHCRVIFSFFSKAIFAVLGRGAILCIFILSLFLTPGASRAQMSQLSDDVLGGISGQAGLSIMMGGSAQVHYDLLSFSDTQIHPNWIELYNFNVDNGSGGPFSFATLWDPVSGELMPNTIDVWTDSSGVTRVSMLDTSQLNPRWYSIGDIVLKYYSDTTSTYSELSLGSLNLDALRQGPSLYRLWAHPTSGISFDYTTTISASALTYTYNTTPTTLSLTGITIAGSATGNPQDATFTTVPWVFSGTFKIGTIGDSDVYDGSTLIFKGNQPATIDVGTDSGNTTSIFLSLPMAGTIRVADVNFGGTDFGPIALDGIQVHRLNVKISP